VTPGYLQVKRRIPGKKGVHWLRVDVHAPSREVFSFQPQTVSANRTAVPAGR